MSCEREIRNLIGAAVPKNFSWDNLRRFEPEGEQIISVKTGTTDWSHDPCRCERCRLLRPIYLIIEW